MLFEKGQRYPLEMVENLGSRAGRSLQKSSLQWYLLLLRENFLVFHIYSLSAPLKLFPPLPSPRYPWMLLLFVLDMGRRLFHYSFQEFWNVGRWNTISVSSICFFKLCLCQSFKNESSMSLFQSSLDFWVVAHFCLQSSALSWNAFPEEASSLDMWIPSSNLQYIFKI